MAKKSVIQRALKRERLVKKYAVKRAELKKTLSDPKVTEEAFYEAQRALAKLPRSSSKPPGNPTEKTKPCPLLLTPSGIS